MEWRRGKGGGGWAADQTRSPASPPSGLARLPHVKQVNQADNCGDDEDRTHQPPKSGTPPPPPSALRAMAQMFAIVARHAAMVPRSWTQARIFAVDENLQRRWTCHP